MRSEALSLSSHRRRSRAFGPTGTIGATIAIEAIATVSYIVC